MSNFRGIMTIPGLGNQANLETMRKQSMRRAQKHLRKQVRSRTAMQILRAAENKNLIKQ